MNSMTPTSSHHDAHRRAKGSRDHERSTLKPVLSLTELVFYGVGVIVGAGVYTVIGVAAGLAHDALWLSFVLGAVVALLTAFSYAELSAAFPEAGAEYVYVRYAWPKSSWLPYGVGVILSFGGVATAATVATAFGGYLQTFANIAPGWSALALLVSVAAVAVVGLKESSAINIAFTTIEVAGLIVVIAIGFAAEPRAVATINGEPSVLAAAALLFFVYLGFEETANLAEEARNPERDLPAAIFLSVVVTTVLYILIGVAVLRLATPAELAGSSAPLAAAVEGASPRAAAALGAIGLFATANTVLIATIATSRLIFAMARDGELPARFGRLTRRRRTPLNAVLLVSVASGTFLMIGGVRLLAEISSFSALLAFLLVNLSVVALRLREPHRPRPFRIPGRIGKIPVVPVAAMAFIVIFFAHFSWLTYLAGAVCLAVASVAYAMRPRRSSDLDNALARNASRDQV